MAKVNKNKIQVKSKQSVKPQSRKKIDWMMATIIGLCFLLYGNTIPNRYSMDDELVAHFNKRIESGIAGIPGIWTSFYAEGKLNYEYRPVVKTSFALEYQFFGESPHISHFINILLYICTCLLLFSLLKRLFKDYNPLFSFITVVLFIAHPVHTEVVSSLKSRDELLSFIGSLATLHYLLKYVNTSSWKYLVMAFFIYILAYLSKSSSLVFIALYPVVLYFYTNSSPKKLLIVFFVILVAALLASIGPSYYLPKPNREVFYFENPIFFRPGILTRFGIGMMSLLFYLKILIFPHPLLFYYGYNTIPMLKLTNVIPMLILLLHIGLFVYAIIKLKEKHILSFIILFYLIAISMFSNIVMPAMGIVAVRFVYSASLAFCLFLSYLIFKFLKINPLVKIIPSRDRVKLFIPLIVIMIPYSAKTIIRNRDWYDHASLYRSDIPYINNSAKANALLGGQLNLELKVALNKGDFSNLRAKSDSIIHYYQRSIDIFPGYYASYNNIGSVYFTALKDYEKAIPYFKKALKMHPQYYECCYNIAYSYEMLGIIKRDSGMIPSSDMYFDSSIHYYRKAISVKHDYVKAFSNLANLYYVQFSNADSAVAINKEIMKVEPSSDAPYINFANYCLRSKDTVTAVSYMEKAIEKNPLNPKLCNNLSRYFKNKHDDVKADKYMELSEKARKKLADTKNND